MFVDAQTQAKEAQYRRVPRSYIIAVGDLTLEERQAKRLNCDIVTVENALKRTIKDRPDDLIVRDALPATDLNLAAQESWLDAVAGVVAAEHQFIGFALPNDRIIGFYGIAPVTVPLATSRIRLTRGATSTSVMGVFQLEQLESRLEPAAYFSETVVFQNNDFVRIMVMSKLATLASTQVIPLLARVCEPAGNTVLGPAV